MTQVIYEDDSHAWVSQKGGVAFKKRYACSIFEKSCVLVHGWVWELLEIGGIKYKMGLFIIVVVCNKGYNLI